MFCNLIRDTESYVGNLISFVFVLLQLRKNWLPDRPKRCKRKPRPKKRRSSGVKSASSHSDGPANTNTQNDRFIGTYLKYPRGKRSDITIIGTRTTSILQRGQDNRVRGICSVSSIDNSQGSDLTRASSASSSLLGIDSSSEIINLPTTCSSQDSGISSSQDLVPGVVEDLDMAELGTSGVDKQEAEGKSELVEEEEPSTSGESSSSTKTESQNLTVSGLVSRKRRAATHEEIGLPKKIKPDRIVESSDEKSDDSVSLDYKARGFAQFLQTDAGKAWLKSADGKQFQSSSSFQEVLLRSISEGMYLDSSGIDSHEPESGFSSMCSICCVRPKNAIIVHGRLAHQATCYQCARRLLDTKSRCPVCRRKIHMVCKNIIV